MKLGLNWGLIGYGLGEIVRKQFMVLPLNQFESIGIELLNFSTLKFFHKLNPFFERDQLRVDQT